VTNKARVEGSMVEATIVKEISIYCSYYFVEQSQNGMKEVPEDHNHHEQLSIFHSPGRALGKGNRRTLEPAAHNYVLLN
jgi:hypothetical protein